MTTVDDVTAAVIEADSAPILAGPSWVARKLIKRMMWAESWLAIEGDCVSAFRLRAARLRLQAAIKERDR